MIAISTPSFDLSGALISMAGTALAESINRRAKRVAVLDLAVGAVPVDAGYTDADLTLYLTIPDADGAHHLHLTKMLAAYQSLILTCERGCYLVMLSGLGYVDGVTTCSAAVLEGLN